MPITSLISRERRAPVVPLGGERLQPRQSQRSEATDGLHQRVRHSGQRDDQDKVFIERRIADPKKPGAHVIQYQGPVSLAAAEARNAKF